jgi:hypothetical protein
VVSTKIGESVKLEFTVMELISWTVAWMALGMSVRDLMISAGL